MAEGRAGPTRSIKGAATHKGGVAAKLRNAFVGVSLFSLFAAIVGIASFAVIERAQDQVLDRSLPAALGAERMAKLGLSVVAATPALLAATDDEALEREAAVIRLASEEMAQMILEMRRLGFAKELLAAIEMDLDRLFDNLDRQVNLVGARNRLSARIDETAAEARANTEQLLEILKPSLVDASARLLAQSDGIRGALSQRRAVRPETLHAFETLADVHFFEVERLTSMRSRADNVSNHIDELLLSVSAEGIASIRQELSINLRSLARSALEIGQPVLRKKIGGILRSLSMIAQGPDNLFQLQSMLIEIDGQLDHLGHANRGRADRLQISVDQLLAVVGNLIEASTEKARGVVGIGRVILVLIAVVAFLVAIYVTWRYVLKDIGARIRRLADITRDLAHGNIEVTVDVGGEDELGEMADAVRVFKANATELHRSNQELEQFAYIASHDLKAPLRGVSNLASWIEQDLDGAMTDETKSHMDLLKGRIGRMETLLEDLLAFSRIGRQETEERPVDLSVTIPEIFKLVIPSDRFSLQITGSLPSLVTAATPLEQVFRNLISNAAKHHDAERGTIEIEVKDLGAVYEFLVRDDGPGIPRQFQEKIFIMFQTLRSRDEIEGSGMGLAIVKKIVESIDCRIDIESDPSASRGTTFRFTWPKSLRSAPGLGKAA